MKAGLSLDLSVSDHLKTDRSGETRRKEREIKYSVDLRIWPCPVWLWNGYSGVKGTISSLPSLFFPLKHNGKSGTDVVRSPHF